MTRPLLKQTSSACQSGPTGNVQWKHCIQTTQSEKKKDNIKRNEINSRKLFQTEKFYRLERVMIFTFIEKLFVTNSITILVSVFRVENGVNHMRLFITVLDKLMFFYTDGLTISQLKRL